MHRMLLHRLVGAATVATAILLHPGPGAAQEAAGFGELPDSIDVISLDTVRVGARIDDLIGIASTASEGRVGAPDLLARPITREGELLETVPGMIVTQHSGEGKANQFFVRGFNLDHGTDFHTRVEGMPVNLPTHGHGQGYTDLNFIIAELVDLLDYRLGVYHVELGDFGSAGGAEIHLARRLERPFATLTLGEHGFARLVAGGSTSTGPGDLLLGAEGRIYDGPWELDQDLRKFNGIARYTWSRGDSRFSLLGLAYGNRWIATDQIPLRAVQSGRLDRFGHVDPSNGGEAGRYSVSGGWHRVGDRVAQEAQLFAIQSDLDLFSNFTYFLENAAGGDQFQQKDQRLVLGGNVKHLQEIHASGVPHLLTAGLQHRTDRIDDVGLFWTADRRRVETIRRDAVLETATGVFLEAESRWRPWIRTLLGLRGDGYTFDVDASRPENSGSAAAAIVSPKASVVVTPSEWTELYLSGGYGFHSNDARGTTISIDPVTGEPAQPVDPLVRSRGAEVGIRLNRSSALRSTLAAWILQLDSELVFVGDAGATEPSDGTTRTGVTWSTFYRPKPALSIDADLSLARARIDRLPAGEDRLPGAMERVFSGGIAWMPREGIFGAVRIRHLGEYPLIEDNSARADAATLVSAEAGLRLVWGARVEAAVLNLFDTAASDIEYFYVSRLPGEPAGGVEDIHFHPVEPRQVRVSVTWAF